MRNSKIEFKLHNVLFPENEKKRDKINYFENAASPAQEEEEKHEGEGDDG